MLARGMCVTLGLSDSQACACAQAETFNWTQQWYPLFFDADLSTTKPTPVQLLGKDIVVWKTPEGTWSALEDLCPHRLAPLSGEAFDSRTRHSLTVFA